MREIFIQGKKIGTENRIAVDQAVAAMVEKVRRRPIHIPHLIPGGFESKSRRDVGPCAVIHRIREHCGGNAFYKPDLSNNYRII